MLVMLVSIFPVPVLFSHPNDYVCVYKQNKLMNKQIDKT